MSRYKGQTSAYGFYISFKDKTAILTLGYNRVSWSWK